MRRTHVQSSRLLHIRKIHKIAFATLLVTAGAVLSVAATAQQVPRQLQPHNNERLLVQAHAKGDQVYTCKRDGAQFTWTAAILIIVSTSVAYFSTPKSSTRTAKSFGVAEGLEIGTVEHRRRPAEWLEYTPALSIVISIVGFVYLAQVVATKGPLATLDLNTYNFFFLMAGLLLHWRPSSFTRAVNNSISATSGVLIQFPFYGGIFGIVSMSPISGALAHFFVRVSSHTTFPLLVAMYSALLGFFVPSGGRKWIIEAPYVLQAAKYLHVHLG